MRNRWLLSRALKDAISNMMDLYRGRCFDNMSEITDMYNQNKNIIFHDAAKKFGAINVHVDIKAIQELDGKYYVEEMKIKSL